MVPKGGCSGRRIISGSRDGDGEGKGEVKVPGGKSEQKTKGVLWLGKSRFRYEPLRDAYLLFGFLLVGLFSDGRLTDNGGVG